MSRKFIIDTDTASDDAVAIIMALRWPDVEVKALTVTSGNIPLNQAVINALYTVELCGADVPVYRGADRPLLRAAEHAEWFHGEDGMGNQNYPPPKRAEENKHAVDALIETISANAGIVLVTLGPLTNVAMAVTRAPEIVGNVSRCVVMGGAANTVGNVSPAAEYNIWYDPEAARLVFRSGLPIEMVGWEHCRGASVLTEDEIAYIRSLDTSLAHFTIDSNQTAIDAYHIQTGEHGLSLADPTSMAVALDPTICTRMGRHYVDIETQSELTRGMTVVDQLGVAGDERNREVWKPLIAREPNASVCWEFDAKRFKEALYSVLK
jgi:purine nucleosidase